MVEGSKMRGKTAICYTFVCLVVSLLTAVLITGCGSRESEKVKVGRGALYHYRLAAEKYRAGDFDSAINIYEKALQMDPDLAEAHLDIGIIYDDYFNDNDKAAFHYQEFLRLEPDSEKIKMVERWIDKAQEDRFEEPAPELQGAESQDLAAAVSVKDKTQAELKRAKEDIANLEIENAAYHKTISALREEMSELRQRVKDLLGGKVEEGEDEDVASKRDKKLAALARSLESEKTRLWERHRKEKGSLEKSLGLLKKEYGDLKAKKKASDAALERANARLSELRKNAVAGKDADTSDKLLRQKFIMAKDRIAELERRNRLYAKDNKILEFRLKKLEKEMQQHPSAKPITKKERVDQTAPALQHAMAKAKADAEREKGKLRQSYEKKLVEMNSSFKKDMDKTKRELAGAKRQNLVLKEQLGKNRETMVKAEKNHNEMLKRLRKQYTDEMDGMERRFKLEKEILLSKLNEAKKSGSATSSVERRQTTTKKPAAEKSKRRINTKPRRKKAEKQPVTYKVGKNDTLSSIATRFYGDSDQWKKIYNANRGKLSSPKSLYTGQILVIP